MTNMSLRWQALWPTCLYGGRHYGQHIFTVAGTRKGEFTEEQMERAKQICNGCLDAINTEAQLSGTANTTNTAECMKSTQLEWC